MSTQREIEIGPNETVTITMSHGLTSEQWLMVGRGICDQVETERRSGEVTPVPVDTVVRDSAEAICGDRAHPASDLPCVLASNHSTVHQDANGHAWGSVRRPNEAPETPRIWRDIKRSWSLANGELLVLECGHSAHVGPYPTGRCEQSGIGLCRAWCDHCTAKNEIETLRSRVRSLEIERRRESPSDENGYTLEDRLSFAEARDKDSRRSIERIREALGTRVNESVTDAAKRVVAELVALRKVAEAVRAIDGDLSTATNHNYVVLREAIRALPSSCDPKVKP